jgi:hypothetical protein
VPVLREGTSRMTRAASDCTSEHGKNYLDSRLMSEMAMLRQLSRIVSGLPTIQPFELRASQRKRAENGFLAWPQPRPRKKAHKSAATAAGSSAGAKCPPRGKTVQRWMLYRRSKYERGTSGTVWCAKTPNAVGAET